MSSLFNWLPSVMKDLGPSLFYPRELLAIIRMKLSLPSVECVGDRHFCYSTLNKVSRSFAVVIQQLPPSLKDAVCIFYLVLRGLDSVEDDMTFADEQKIVLLREFHQKLSIDGWSISNVGDTKDYRILLEHFGQVISVFKSLEKKYQSIIVDITRRMGEGMADFVGKTGSIDSVENYNLYCHYVAGLVGHGLTDLFIQSELEEKTLDDVEKKLSNSMGLFLQKTNIIRDYLEDLHAGRTWWPEEIWKNYADDLSFFSRHPTDRSSLNCLNDLIGDCLVHLPDVLEYLSRLHDGQIFQFSSIPQLMAVATLSDLFDNPRVFTSVVKLRKGLSCQLMLDSSTFDDVRRWTLFFLEKISSKTNDAELIERIDRSKRMCQR